MSIPYDIESVVLGTVLRYGLDAARFVLPQLTPEKFIFRVDGNFGLDHSIIWEAVSETYFQHRNPTLLEVSSTLKGEYFSEMRALVDRLENQYKIYEFNADSFQRFAKEVDKAGIVYNMAAGCATLHESISDVQSFMHTVNSIEDIDRWTSEQLAKFRQVNTMRVGGYVPIAEIVTSLKERWLRQFAGEEVSLLNCGIPILMKNMLFPKRKLAVVHGMSGSGKSTLVFQACLGTAIDLFLSGQSGCVAINSLEMEQEDLVERMAAILAGVDVSQFMTGKITQAELDRLMTWADFISVLPLFIDNTNFLTTSAMQYRAQGLHVSEHGPVVQLASDYTELFADEDSSEEQRVSKIVREQFFLARMINASVLAISQSTIDKEVSKKTYVAGADGTRYSKGILQATDILVELWNPVSIGNSGRTIVTSNDMDKDGISTSHPWLFVQKYRGAAEGAKIPLGWEPSSTTFFDQDENFGVSEDKRVVYTHLKKAYEKYKGETNAW